MQIIHSLTGTLEEAGHLISSLLPHLKAGFFLWLLIANLSAFFLFGWDKAKARRGESRTATRRIPERTLFLLAGLGGSLGSLLGMYFWRHKTQHSSFRTGIPAILGVQLLLAAMFLLC